MQPIPVPGTPDSRPEIAELVENLRHIAEQSSSQGEFVPRTLRAAAHTIEGALLSTRNSFGDALIALKAGHRVAREGWNGKGMYLYLVPANRYPPTTPSGDELAAREADGLVPYSAYIAMKPAVGGIVPWLASQTDVISEDWIILD